MANVQDSIDVDVPVSTAYNQWTQFDDAGDADNQLPS